MLGLAIGTLLGIWLQVQAEEAAAEERSTLSQQPAELAPRVLRSLRLRSQLQRALSIGIALLVYWLLCLGWNLLAAWQQVNVATTGGQA